MVYGTVSKIGKGYVEPFVKVTYVFTIFVRGRPD